MSDKTSEGIPTPADERLFADWRQELGRDSSMASSRTARLGAALEPKR